MRITPWGKKRPVARTMGFLIVVATFGCGDSTGPPDAPEFFITTDSTSYTLNESGTPDLFFIDLVTRFTNALSDTVYIDSCSERPFRFFEHLSDGVFTRSELGAGCAGAFLGETPFPPGAVRTDTIRWHFSRRSATSAENFDREIPGTFRVFFIVWDSLGENHINREIAKELRVSAPFDILPAPEAGG